jgi:hypothetical protein
MVGRYLPWVGTHLLTSRSLPAALQLKAACRRQVNGLVSERVFRVEPPTYPALSLSSTHVGLRRLKITFAPAHHLQT